jgi:hypothetical protein
MWGREVIHRRPMRVRQAWCPVVVLLLTLPCSGESGVATRPAGSDPSPPQPLPQYLFFNRAPGASRERWLQTHPDRFSADSLQEMVKILGGRTAGSLRFGAAFMFSILERDTNTTATSIRRLLAAAGQADVPVLIGLDGQNWWETRSDLWNWWDPALPGYDPENRLNVEWTGWGPEHAVKIGWRNWGRQLRVRPAPNIESPRVLAEHWKAYDLLIPIVVEWYRSLPPERRYLLGGVKVGWEASINVNAFYYTNGNAVFERRPNDPSQDPTERDRAQGWTFGQTPLGYAAVSTAGIKRSGTLEKQDIEKVVHRYLQRMARQVADRGVPRSLIFTHQGGNYEPWDRHLSFWPAINEHSVPGWSFYSHDPAESGSLATELASAGREQWAAVEWWRGSGTVAGWKERFEKTLRFRKCRFLCVFNWESFREDPRALQAVRELERSDG